MKIEYINSFIRKFIAEESKVLTDKNRTFYCSMVIPAKTLTEDNFVEIDKSEVPE